MAVAGEGEGEAGPLRRRKGAAAGTTTATTTTAATWASGSAEVGGETAAAGDHEFWQDFWLLAVCACLLPIVATNVYVYNYPADCSDLLAAIRAQPLDRPPWLTPRTPVHDGAVPPPPPAPIAAPDVAAPGAVPPGPPAPSLLQVDGDPPPAATGAEPPRPVDPVGEARDSGALEGRRLARLLEAPLQELVGLEIGAREAEALKAHFTAHPSEENGLRLAVGLQVSGATQSSLSVLSQLVAQGAKSEPLFGFYSSLVADKVQKRDMMHLFYTRNAMTLPLARLTRVLAVMNADGEVQKARELTDLIAQRRAADERASDEL